MFVVIVVAIAIGIPCAAAHGECLGLEPSSFEPRGGVDR
jgi:hypothetical protein